MVRTGKFPHTKLFRTKQYQINYMNKIMLKTTKGPILREEVRTPNINGNGNSPSDSEKTLVRRTLPHKTVCAMVTDITTTGLSLDDKVKNLLYEIGLSMGVPVDDPALVVMTDIINTVSELNDVMAGDDALKSVLLSSYAYPNFSQNMIALCKSAFGYEDSIYRK